MYWFFLLFLPAVLAEDIALSFINTIIPENVELVCEAVNLRYNGNISTCYDVNQTVYSITNNLRLNVQTVVLDQENVVIDSVPDLRFINEYLFNNSFFVFPEVARATKIYKPVNLKAEAYAASIVGVLGLMSVFLVFTEDCAICFRKKRQVYFNESRVGHNLENAN